MKYKLLKESVLREMEEFDADFDSEFPVGFSGHNSSFGLSNDPEKGVTISVNGQSVVVPPERIKELCDFVKGLSGEEDGEDAGDGSRDDALNALADDEEEAIDGYDDLVGDVDDSNTKDQLMHIRDEEVAHKKYLDKAKSDKDAQYEHD